MLPRILVLPRIETAWPIKARGSSSIGAIAREASNCSRKFGPANRGSAAFLPADFSSLAEVRRLANTVRQECDRLDILINNAGIGSGGSAGKREISQDGPSAGFLLTRVLLPLVMLGKRPAS
jgi:NAD(P)-dependent dehydrogenase (short-subunit alcohol dehydrogenase family)